MIEDILGLRKFIFTLVGVICATLALLIGKINADVWLQAMQWLGGFFVVGNAVEHIKNAITGEI